MKKYILLFITCWVISIGQVFAQVDSVFWFAPPWITASHDHTPISVCITSYDDPVSVTINQPANPSFTPFTFDLAANSFRKINISELGLSESQFITGYDKIYPYGIFITSTGGTIGAYVQYDGSNSEAYTLKGKNGLGTDFIIPMQFGYYNYSYSNCSSTIEIIASEDYTEVFITPSQATPEHPAGEVFSITLMKGESYAIQAAGRDGSQHLRNTIIHSTKPIAVNVSDDSVYLSGWDLVGDQILPVSFAGTTYIAIKNDGSDCLYFFPTEDNTNIYVNGETTPICNLNKGGEYAYRMNSTATLITSDKPILVFDLTAWSGEFGGTVLPQLECTGSRMVAFTPLRSNPKITVVTKTEYINDFNLTGTGTTLTAADFAPVPGDPQWSYCVKTISIGGGSPLRITNSNGLFHVGVFDMSSGTLSYSYFSDYKVQSSIKIDVEIVQGVASFCEGAFIELRSIPGWGIDHIAWNGANNLHLEDEDPIFDSAQTKHTGEYVVTGTSRMGCEVIPGRVFLQINLPSDTNLYAEICEGEAYEFAGKKLDTTGVYTDSLTNRWNCDSLVHLHLEVHPLEDTLIEAYICEGDSFLFGGRYYSEENIYTDHLTSQYGCDSTATLDLHISPSYQVNIYDTICEGEKYDFFDQELYKEDRYIYVVHTIHGCDSTIILYLTVLPKPVVNLGPDELICSDQATSVVLRASNGFDHFDSYLWLPDSSTGSTLTVTESGTYTVRVQKLKCFSESSKKVEFRIFSTSLGNDTTLCMGETMVLQPNPLGKEYSWNTGSTASQITTDPQQSQIYSVEVTDEFGCTATASKTVNMVPLPIINLYVQNPESADTCLSNQLVIHAESAGNTVVWKWNTGETSQNITVNKQGIYSVQATDYFGCIGTNEVNIEACPCLVYLSNAFTPDGNHHNDYYAPAVNNAVQSIEMTIFTRWGREIYNQKVANVELTEGETSTGLAWDGTVNGEECQPGMYFCTVTYTCKAEPNVKHTMQSRIMLIR